MLKQDILKIRHLTSDLSVTWNPQWISPTESLWCAFEKFRLMNIATQKDILDLFGTEKVKNQRSRKQSSNNLIEPQGIDGESLEIILGMNLKKLNLEVLSEIIGVITDDIINFVSSDLRFCTECMTVGFHSIYHQILLLNKCPFHDKALRVQCPKCKSKIPYSIAYINIETPFMCNCGHYLYDFTCRSNREDWALSNGFRLVLDDLNEWYRLSPVIRDKVKKLYFIKEQAVHQAGDLMKNLLAITRETKQHLPTHTHFVVKSIETIRYIVNEDYRNKDLERYSINIEWKIDLYSSMYSTFKAVARYIKRKYLIGHEYCIRKLTIQRKNELSTDCELAWAYVKWRMAMIEENNSEYVHNLKGERSKLLNKKFFYSGIQFIPPEETDFLTELYEMYLKMGDKKNTAWLKWILNRVIGSLTLEYFYAWLELSKKVKNDKLAKYSIPDIKQLPFFLVLVPKEKSHAIEYHQWQLK